jgi:hypothetical protein
MHLGLQQFLEETAIVDTSADTRANIDWLPGNLLSRWVATPSEWPAHLTAWLQRLGYVLRVYSTRP